MSALHELRRAAPYAIVLAVLLGLVVVVGANLSNAFPSQERPFGWSGPANLENGVAMVRPDIVLATTIPALLLGATALRGRDPHATRATALLPVLAVDGALLVLACATGGLIAFVGAARSPFSALMAFACAQSLLALAFYALAFFAAAIVPRFAIAASVGVWGFFTFIYEGWMRVILFRQVGYDNLKAGAFPLWFWISQAASPLTAYRGVLILWRNGFMDYLEKAALGNASLPVWMTPATFAGLLVVAWVALPLAMALGAWQWRGRRALPSAAGRAPEGTA